MSLPYSFFRFILLLLVAFLSYFAVAQEDALKQTIPAGWSLYPTPQQGSLALRCGNYSGNEWQVLRDNRSIRIGPLPKAAGKCPSAKLPPRLQHEPGMLGCQSTFKLQDGWLLGCDCGEFGGGLWRTNDDGSVTTKLSDENVHGILPTSRGVLVLADLSHGFGDSGKVFIISNDNSAQSQIRPLATLDGAPQASIQESADTILVTTTHGVSRVNSTGTVKTIVHGPFSSLYPNSMAIMPDGTVYVGMMMFVVRYIPQATGYTEQWLIRSNCQKFSIRNYDCVCRGSGSQ